ncbi:MAG TPA: hypothetical protein VII96_03945 [Acidimicrobiales bacterium]
MGFMDKVKAQAEVGMAKANDLTKAGQEKLDQASAKHKADGMLHDLGAALYAERVGRGTDQTAADVERLVADLQAHEVEHGNLEP